MGDDKIKIDLSRYPREALRILRHMARAWPKKKAFLTNEVSTISGIQGRSLGGVLGGYAKHEDFPLIVKIGSVNADPNGKKLSRPENVWRLNPQLTKPQIDKIKETLEDFLLDEF